MKTQYILLFLDLSGGEILLILFLVLILFGPNKIPEIARGLAKAIREFNNIKQDIKDEITKTNINIKQEVSETIDKKINEALKKHSNTENEIIASTGDLTLNNSQENSISKQIQQPMNADEIKKD
jgi:TatA/E family protein of Tat protein translocase